jgi:hypothetical protein
MLANRSLFRTRNIRAVYRGVIGGLVLLLAPGLRAETTVVSVPVSLDYPLMIQLLVTQLFQSPDNSRNILDDSSGCSQIVLSDPEIGPQRDQLEIVVKAKAKLGLNVFGDCQELLNWQGRAGFIGLPVIKSGGRSVKLEPRETWLIGSDGVKMSSGPLWETGVAGLESLFGSFEINFAPYTDSLAAFLPEVLPDRSAQQITTMANSLTLTAIDVSPEGLTVAINIVVDALDEEAAVTTALSEEELQQFEQRWQMMDALLVSAVKHYAAATSLEMLRSALLDTLIDSRYRLRDALTEPASRSNDAVRHWFVDSWQRLAPVVRRIAMDQEGQGHLLWLSLFTATDALYALDQLGPSIGLDISTDGLRRMARMINEGEVDELLRYGEEVDPQLQQLLQQQIQQQQDEPSAWRFDFSFVSQAYAAVRGDTLNMWVPKKKELEDYLPKIADLLEESAETVLQKQDLKKDYRNLYENLVLATAWQESCWRQYVVKNKKIVPLKSSSGDVGLMQINERVWRGFYDLQKLRWDINYNSNAGAEVLMNYLVKYAVKRGEQNQPGGINNLARASYSAYNGGPRAVSRYRRSDVPSAHQKIDGLFWDKYRQVDIGNELNVAECLGGKGWNRKRVGGN